MDGIDNHTFIENVSTDATEQLDKRNHALNGTITLTSTSNFGLGAGISPIGDYAGFITGSTAPTITAATFNYDNKHKFASGETIASLGFVEGAYYPYDGLKQITITAGSLLLIRKNNY